MSKIVLGRTGERDAKLEIDLLLRNRLLIQANSGKGKSFLLRRLAEQLFGKVQVLIIDPEGEFATLREKFDYVLVGKGGETAAHPRIAALTAQRLLEIRASAVIDLYEMKPSERHSYVHLFLDSLIDAPKTLWHSVVIILDEAHVYCPEKGESEAADAVIGMATRGRKRGFCLIAATQRLGKFRKDAAAELVNVAIGGTFIDIDRKRAADALGVYGHDTHKFFDEIRLLKPGSFYFLGPAISTERILVQVGPVETTHPEAGSSKHATEPPPAPDKIKALLPKLADLPKEAEEKAKTEAEFRREIRELKAQLTKADKQAPAAAAVPASTRDLRLQDRTIRELRSLLGDAMKICAKVNLIGFDAANINAEEMKTALNKAAEELGRLARHKLEVRSLEFERLKTEMNRLLARLQKQLAANDAQDLELAVDVKKNEPITARPTAIPVRREAAESNGNISGPQHRILTALADFNAIGRTKVAKSWIAARAGVSHSSGSFANNLGTLRSQGLIDYPGAGVVSITPAGLGSVPEVESPLTSAEMLKSCIAILSGPQAMILQLLHREHPGELEKERIAEQVGVSASSGSFANNLGALRSAGMVDYPRKGVARCADWLFID